jgi:predicted glutamine amidotransferase
MVGFGGKGKPEALVKSTLPATDDPGLERAVAAMQTYPTVLAHLRKASVGGVSLENTHPFVERGWAMGHNGTIGGDYHRKFGDGHANDSRVLFQRVLARLQSKEPPEDALRGSVRELVQGGFSFTSITVLLTDGAHVYAAREVRRDVKYYEMQWRLVEGRVVFCQEPILPGAWESLPNHRLAIGSAKGVETTPL